MNSDTTKKQELIAQLCSSYEFLHHKWLTTKDPKQSEEIKSELLKCQEQLRRAKGD